MFRSREYIQVNICNLLNYVNVALSMYVKHGSVQNSKIDSTPTINKNWRAKNKKEARVYHRTFRNGLNLVWKENKKKASISPSHSKRQ